jgi:hypothetical protein
MASRSRSRLFYISNLRPPDSYGANDRFLPTHVVFRATGAGVCSKLEGVCLHVEEAAGWSECHHYGAGGGW